jgi:hypothetical protein
MRKHNSACIHSHRCRCWAEWRLATVRKPSCMTSTACQPRPINSLVGIPEARIFMKAACGKTFTYSLSGGWWRARKHATCEPTIRGNLNAKWAVVPFARWSLLICLHIRYMHTLRRISTDKRPSIQEPV